MSTSDTFPLAERREHALIRHAGRLFDYLDKIYPGRKDIQMTVLEKAYSMKDNVLLFSPTSTVDELKALENPDQACF